MTPLIDTIVATLNAQWGELGGAKPDIATTVTSREGSWDTPEWIRVHPQRYRNNDPFNDEYSDVDIQIPLRINTATSQTRLEEIMTEVRRIIQDNPLEGTSATKIGPEIDFSEPERHVFQQEMILIVEIDTTDLTLSISAPINDALEYLHTNVDDEIHQLAEKGEPVNADLVIIEDSADSWAKKAVSFSNFIGHAKYTDAEAITAVEGEATLDLTGILTVVGAVTLASDGGDVNVGDSEVVFDDAKLTAQNGYFKVRPGSGNQVGKAAIVPSGNQDEAELEIRNSANPVNYDDLMIVLDGAIATIDAEQHGSGAGGITHLHLGENIADISISKAGAQTNVEGNLDVAEGVDVTGDITATGTVDGVDVSVHAVDVDAHHAKYTDIEARAAVVSDAIYGPGWDSVATYAPSKNAVYDRIQSHEGDDDAHHDVWEAAEDAAAIAAHAGDDDAHHAKYTDAEAKAAAVLAGAFGSGWNGETKAPTQDAVYDAIRQRLTPPECNLWLTGNGASIGGGFASTVIMPASDSNCYFHGGIIVPSTWITGTTTYLNIMYFMGTANQGYSVNWHVAAQGIGEALGWNILNSSGAYDYDSTNPSAIWAVNQVPLGTSPTAGDRISIKCTSNASNGTVLYVVGMWLSW